MAMDIAQLKTLIDSEPLNAAKTDVEVLTWCNTPSVASEYATLTGSELLAATAGAELDALADTAAQKWLVLCGVDNVPVQNGGAAATLATTIFGGGSATITNLVAKRTYTATPVASVGLGEAREAYVTQARSL